MNAIEVVDAGETSGQPVTELIDGVTLMTENARGVA